MGECRIELPSLRGEPGGGLAAVAPPSRRPALEALMDSVEEVVVSREPVVTVIVGEWGEGKTWAWRAYVRPALQKRGFECIEVRASTLYEAMRRASWITSPAWRLVTAALVASGLVENVPGDYRRVVGERLGGKTVVFIDEVEDLVYHGGALDEFLEALHALLDGEAGAPLVHVYASVSPAAYAKMVTWPSWRRLRRRIRVVELKPVTRGEAIEALREMLSKSAGGLPLSDPRLLNAVAEASKGNLGALAAYARRLLAAYSRRGCKPLAPQDVLRILSEPLSAGLLDAGVDVERLEGVAGGREEARQAILLMVLGEDEAKGLEDIVERVPVCEARSLDDRVFVGPGGSLVALGGVMEEYLREAGGVVEGSCSEGVSLYAVKPEVLAVVYGGHPSLASFIRDEALRRRAVREAYRDPGLAARGLIAAMCTGVHCKRCRLVDEGGVAEVNIGGLWVRVVAAPSYTRAAPLVSSVKPHVVLVLGGSVSEPGLYPRVVSLSLDPISQIQLAALGSVVGGECRAEGVDAERVNVLWALVDSRYHILDEVLEALRRSPPLVVPWVATPSGRDRVLAVLRLLALRGRARPVELSQIGSRLGISVGEGEAATILQALSRHGIVEKRGDVFAVTLSPVEEAVTAVLEALGGRCRVSELAERLVEERPGALVFWLRVLNVKGYVDAPKRITGRSAIRVMPLEELRSRALALLERLPDEFREEPRCDTEACERAWLSAIQWLVEILARRETVEKREHSPTGQEHGPASPHLQLLAAKQGQSAPAVDVMESRSGGGGGAALRLLEKRLWEAVRLAPLAALEGRIEELASVVAHAKQLARRGRVEDSLMELNDTIAVVSRPPDTSLIMAARNLDPSIVEVLEMIEDSGVVRRVLEKIVAKRAGELLQSALERVEAKLIRSARLA